jgi:hypothetical protein
VEENVPPLICRMFLSFCDGVASPQEMVSAPAWAPQSRTCAHVDTGAPTPEATPKPFAVGTGPQQWLEYAPAPPSYGQVSNSSKAHRREE